MHLLLSCAKFTQQREFLFICNYELTRKVEYKMPKDHKFADANVERYMKKLIQKAYDEGWDAATTEAYGEPFDSPLEHYETELRRVERLLDQALEYFEAGDMVQLERLLRDNVDPSGHYEYDPNIVKTFWVANKSTDGG